jgi:DNA-binding response OmpR family regulator
MADILLIEPDIRLARTYALALQSAGHSVRTAATGQAAVCLADELRPDVVVLELQLVAHSGIEFLYEFRSYTDWHDVPVLVVSHVPPAEFEASHKLLHGRLGVSDYHYKPRLTLRTLQAAVDNALAAPA